MAAPLPAPPIGGYFTCVRTLFASALFALACGCSDRSSRPSGADATPSIPGGPDPVVLRVARDGGLVTASTYPGLDSVLWRSSTRAPAISEIIAFGAEDGYLAAIDSRRSPVRIDLRLGAVARTRDSSLQSLASADGSAIYALTDAGELTRFTPSGGDWKFQPALPAAALLPQADGSLIVAGAREDRAVVWRVRPPGNDVVDTLWFDVGGDARANAATMAATAGSVGDRVFFGVNESVIAVRSRDLQPALEIDLGDPIRALTASPSADRLFVALADDRSLRVVDRFEERVSDKIRLPGVPLALRMDPLGRLLLAHGGGDSVFVVSLANGEVVGTVRSAWRSDLPFVLADGAIALARGDDVVLTVGESLADGRTIAGGARDFWYGLRWNGFRPRAAGLDQPVEFRRSAPRDTSGDGARDSMSDTVRSTVPPDATAQAGILGDPSPTRRAADSAAPSVFSISFASVQTEKAARDVASRLRVAGVAPRITTFDGGGTMVYRVVMGPFASRAEAERIGKASGQSYWIFEGVP